MAFGSKKRKEAETEMDREAPVDIDSGDEMDPMETDDGGEDERTEVPTKTKKGNPLHDEVVILSAGKGKNPGGSKSWQCKHCNKTFVSTSTRIQMHFFGAPIGKPAQIARCEALLSDRAKYRELYEKFRKGGSSKPASTVKPNPVADAFAIVERDAVDMAIMRCLCANGIPFNVLRSPQWSEMIAAINKAPKGYKSPSSEKARTSLLDACKRNVEQELAPVRKTWLTYGLSIVSDGWTNQKNKPLINVIASNSRGSMFLYAEDFSGIEKTGEAIAQYLLKAIDELGESNVLQVVTDNASNCKAAGREIEKVHKHIFWTPCVVHTLNLIFKDLAKSLPWIEETYSTGKALVNYMLNHQHGLAIFRANSKLDLLRVAKTRFASHYILLKRLSDCREALATTVVTKQWKDWMKHNASDKYAKIAVDTINSDEFWSEVESVLALTKPLFLMVKFSDGEGPKMGEIYERMDTMLGQIKDVMAEQDYPHKGDFPEVNNIVLSRWEKMSIPLHCLAFALCPEYYDSEYLKKPAPGGIPRKAPNQDKEVMRGVLEAFRKIADNDDERKIYQTKFTAFHMRKGMYALAAVQNDATTMSAIDWWSNYGSETPNLAALALKVLSQPISSSSAERNWSTYSYIHSVKRNRLNAKTADKLVYVHSNIRLLSRFSESYKADTYKWDANPDETSLEESRLKLEQLRWKGLVDDGNDDAPNDDQPGSSSKHKNARGRNKD
ncbi:unnamed protein product [Urochloa humidicola]